MTRHVGKRESGPGRRQALVEALLQAYRSGAFPMADPDTGRIDFYTTRLRGVFDLDRPDGFRVSRSLARRLRSGWFDVRSDTAFERVMRGCAADRPDESWINETLIDWCGALHEAGHAHCVETWRTDPATGKDVLVGGIYGVTLGGAFFGESMFSRPMERLASGERRPLDGTNASKVALYHCFHHLRARGFRLFDTQFQNPYLATLGCREISASEYERRLRSALRADASWDGFTPSPPPGGASGPAPRGDGG